MALANFITDAALLASVKAALGVDPSDSLSGEWTPIVANANRTATLDIYERLCAQGFSVGQVASWDLGPDYALQQGTYWALTWGSGLGGYSAPKLDHMDRREDLSEKSVLIVDGTPTAASAANSDVGGISFGTSAAGVSAAAQFNAFANGQCSYNPSCGCG